MAKVLARLATVPLVAGEDHMWDAVPSHVDDAPTARVTPFADRTTAGAMLGQALAIYARTSAVVLGIANGGLVVARAVAQTLQLPVDVWLVRAIRQPLGPSMSLGTIAEGPSVKLDRKALKRSGLTDDEVRAIVRINADQMTTDARRLRRRRPTVDLTGRTAILVDDGIQTAASLSVAIDGVRRRGASFVVVASPVGAHASVHRLTDEADDAVCLMSPDQLTRVGAWYQDFRRVSDLAVMKILASVTAS